MARTRPGWGSRHPELTALLQRVTPAATVETFWAGGSIPLRLTAYLGQDELPPELVTSVRCIVRVDDHVVVCTNEDGSHPWPGGRREGRESFVETACREVHEETGWLLDPSTVQRIGWLHIENLEPQPPHHPWPHPDFLQIVTTGVAHDRDGGRDNDWTDVEGWETSSVLLPVVAAATIVEHEPLAAPFLALL
jgi:hypothetical protein